jgi:hypothetical protein
MQCDLKSRIRPQQVDFLLARLKIGSALPIQRGQNNANWTIVSFVLTLKLNQKGAGAAVIFSRTPADIACFLGMATKFFPQSPFIAATKYVNNARIWPGLAVDL